MPLLRPSRAVDVNVIQSPSLDEVEHEVERCHLLVEVALALTSPRHGGLSVGRVYS